MKHYFRLLRPSQWIKNVFVFAPLVFSKHLFDPLVFFAAFKGFIAFSIVSSAVYVFNDIFDKDADAAHPVKKNRPIASGAVSDSGSAHLEPSPSEPRIGCLSFTSERVSDRDRFVPHPAILVLPRIKEDRHPRRFYYCRRVHAPRSGGRRGHRCRRSRIGSFSA